METGSETVTELAEHLRIALARSARRLRQEAHSELTPTLTAALATIGREGPITPSELARRESVQRPTATKLIAKLEERGLVLRTADPEDGRSCLIAITGAGRRLLHEVRTRKDVFLARRLQELGDGDRATLARASVLLEDLVRP